MKKAYRTLIATGVGPSNADIIAASRCRLQRSFPLPVYSCNGKMRGYFLISDG
jgi:hypothetical protein